MSAIKRRGMRRDLGEAINLEKKGRLGYETPKSLLT